jgi:hypothetical protein
LIQSGKKKNAVLVPGSLTASMSAGTASALMARATRVSARKMVWWTHLRAARCKELMVVERKRVDEKVGRHTAPVVCAYVPLWLFWTRVTCHALETQNDDYVMCCYFEAESSDNSFTNRMTIKPRGLSRSSRPSVSNMHLNANNRFRGIRILGLGSAA